MKLASFIQKLSGETLSVTLKNGSVIQGNLIGSDVSMNMHLKSVKVALKGKNPVSMDALSIRGNNVRYIMLVLNSAGRSTFFILVCVCLFSRP